jgi:hypothetical protein
MIIYQDMKMSFRLCSSSNVERKLAKKHVFGSSVGYRGGWLPNSCLRVGNHGIMQ